MNSPGWPIVRIEDNEFRHGENVTVGYYPVPGNSESILAWVVRRLDVTKSRYLIEYQNGSRQWSVECRNHDPELVVNENVYGQNPLFSRDGARYRVLKEELSTESVYLLELMSDESRIWCKRTNVKKPNNAIVEYRFEKV